MSKLWGSVSVIFVLGFCVHQTTSLVLESMGEWCPPWKNLQCGSNGITYWNECLFNKTREHYLSDLEKVNEGPCYQDYCSECKAPHGRFKYCTTSNKMLKSRCEVDCFAETYPQVKENPKGCKNHHPSYAQLENASPALLTKIINSFLVSSLSYDPTPKNDSMLVLNPLNGNIIQEKKKYSIVCSQGYAERPASLQITGEFHLSAAKMGRFITRLSTGEFKAGYKQFQISVDGVSNSSLLEVTVKDAVLQLTADFETDSKHCNKIKATNLEVIDIQWSRPEDFPPWAKKFEGFIRENLNRKINEAYHASIFARMHTIGCLKGAVKDKCFGAFQAKFCPG